jgi:acyl-lipid Delta6-acetylenase / acyl-lipid (9-3)-desaturase
MVLMLNLLTASFGCLMAVNAFTLQRPHVAFTAPSSLARRRLSASSATTALWSTIAPPPPRVANGTSTAGSSTSSDQPTAWECDEDAQCVLVPACDEEVCRTSLDVRIHNKWYDLSGWRKAHPAGAHWIDWYDGRDATEVMDAFHSEKGRKMYQRLPASKPETAQMLESTAVPDSPTQIAFRKLREDLEKEGWWERDMTHEATQLSLWAAFVIGAAYTAHSLPIVSMSLLSISMTAAGWLGHDYIHGVDPFCDRMRNFAALAAGLLPTWWSDKHNKHHALTNEQGVDEDIATDPFIFPYVPDPSQDSPLRKIQHYIFWIPFSFLFALWRVDSVTVAIEAVESKRPAAKSELYCLLAHYLVLLTVFPVQVWIPAIFLSGLISALIVTPTHQSEEMFADYQPDWVTAQFLSTRNAVTTNPFSEWVWGGMQYQLEHHLFPSMPRNRYPALRERLQKFATNLNIPGGYRESDEWEILKMNWQLYKNVAGADAIPGAPLSRGHLGQQAAIVNTASPGAKAGPAAFAAAAGGTK